MLWVFNRGQQLLAAVKGRRAMNSLGCSLSLAHHGYGRAARLHPSESSLSGAQCAAFCESRAGSQCHLSENSRTTSLHSPRGIHTWRRSTNCRHGFGLNAALQSVEQRGAAKSDITTTEYCIERICLAIGVGECSSGGDEHFTVSGTQTLLAMDGRWQLKWTKDGQFWEQFNGTEMTLEWAYDGENDEAWAVDAAGRVSTLELDDREVCLLTSWIRTGFWVTERGRERLSIRLERGDVAAGVDEASSLELMLSVQLNESKVVAYVVIDATTWYPQRASMKAFGGWGKWQYSDWQALLVDGGRDKGALGRPVYSLPHLPTVPRPQLDHPHAHMDPRCPPSVQMIRAESGHYLVRPLVNGKDIGYFIVDTGASSLTIVPQKARELGLYEFGQVHVTGAEGEVQSQYCRAKSFQLGPLQIANPVFMEVPIAGLARGVSRVAGICGYDIFYHCIVEMAYAEEGTLSLFDPLMYSRALQWHSMQMIESVPHVWASFNGHIALFLLDTGAGGVDVIFHGRSVEEFELLNTVRPESLADLIGVNASGEGLQVTLGTMDKLDVAGRSFWQVKALLAEKNAGNLDTSEYVAGLVCGDLLTRSRVVFDYAQRRLAFVDS